MACVTFNGASATDRPVFIQPTQPTVDGPYLWIQTDVTGTQCIKIWIEDGN